jgi:type IV secretion system protein VirB1
MEGTMDFIGMSQQCASSVEPERMLAIVKVESGLNPYAIGVVNGRLERQPRNLAEAVVTADALERDGWNFSLGMSQVNRYNLPKYKLDYKAAFDPCSNLRAGASILKDCYDRARPQARDTSTAWQMAYSCYYSGNFRTGFKADFKDQPSYVHKAMANMGEAPGAIRVIAVRAPAQPIGKVTAAPASAAKEAVNDTWAVLGAKEI